MNFITGNNFVKLSHFYFGANGIEIIRPVLNNQIPIFFIKTDYVDSFFQNIKLEEKVIIITHNSDYGISENFLKYLNLEMVFKWYAQNVCVHHKKLYSIPIGIANSEWPHGNLEILQSVLDKNNDKSNLIYCNFNLNTNIQERSKCLKRMEKFELKLSPTIDFKSYLTDLSKSYFVVSPNGNGIDCHKTWEALYLKTIPIVTKSINSLYYSHLPIIFIDDWSNFDINNFSFELYNSLWYNFDINQLNFTNYESSILHS
jgi:hypothetical protein